MKVFEFPTIIRYNGQESYSIQIYVHLKVGGGYVGVINKHITKWSMDGVVKGIIGHNLLDSYALNKTKDEWLTY